MNPSKCPKSGKTKYQSHEEANQGITYIWSRDSTVNIGDLETYCCPDCGDIHIRHKMGKTPNKVIMENVIEQLKKLGWEENGTTSAQTFLIPTIKSPLFGKSGGELRTFAGRLRFKRGKYYVTIGGKTVFFYEKDLPNQSGKYKRLPTKSLDAILKTSESEFRDE